MRRRTGAVKCAEFIGHEGATTCVDFGKSGLLLATGGNDCLAYLWLLGKQGSIARLTGHKKPLSCVRFHASERWLAAGSESGALKTFDATIAKLLLSFPGHKASVSALDWHPTEGTALVSGGADCVVRLWDVRNSVECNAFRGHGSPVTALRFTPFGQWCASGSADGRICVWDMQAGKLLHTFEPTVLGSAASVAAVAATTALLSANRGSKSSPGGHRGPVSSLAFHEEELLMASGGSSDHTVRFFDMDPAGPGQRLITATTNDTGAVRAVRFLPPPPQATAAEGPPSRGGTALASITSDHVRIWGVPLPPSQLQAQPTVASCASPESATLDVLDVPWAGLAAAWVGDNLRPRQDASRSDAGTVGGGIERPGPHLLAACLAGPVVSVWRLDMRLLATDAAAPHAGGADAALASRGSAGTGVSDEGSSALRLASAPPASAAVLQSRAPASARAAVASPPQEQRQQLKAARSESRPRAGGVSASARAPPADLTAEVTPAPATLPRAPSRSRAPSAPPTVRADRPPSLPIVKSLLPGAATESASATAAPTHRAAPPVADIQLSQLLLPLISHEGDAGADSARRGTGALLPPLSVATPSADGATVGVAAAAPVALATPRTSTLWQGVTRAPPPASCLANMQLQLATQMLTPPASDQRRYDGKAAEDDDDDDSWLRVEVVATPAVALQNASLSKSESKQERIAEPLAATDAKSDECWDIVTAISSPSPVIAKAPVPNASAIASTAAAAPSAATTSSSAPLPVAAAPSPMTCVSEAIAQARAAACLAARLEAEMHQQQQAARRKSGVGIALPVTAGGRTRTRSRSARPAAATAAGPATECKDSRDEDAREGRPNPSPGAVSAPSSSLPSAPAAAAAVATGNPPRRYRAPDSGGGSSPSAQMRGLHSAGSSRSVLDAGGDTRPHSAAGSGGPRPATETPRRVTTIVAPTHRSSPDTAGTAAAAGRPWSSPNSGAPSAAAAPAPSERPKPSNRHGRVPGPPAPSAPPLVGGPAAPPLSRPPSRGEGAAGSSAGHATGAAATAVPPPRRERRPSLPLPHTAAASPATAAAAVPAAAAAVGVRAGGQRGGQAAEAQPLAPAPTQSPLRKRRPRPFEHHQQRREEPAAGGGDEDPFEDADAGGPHSGGGARGARITAAAASELRAFAPAVARGFGGGEGDASGGVALRGPPTGAPMRSLGIGELIPSTRDAPLWLDFEAFVPTRQGRGFGASRVAPLARGGGALGGGASLGASLTRPLTRPMSQQQGRGGQASDAPSLGARDTASAAAPAAAGPPRASARSGGASDAAIALAAAAALSACAGEHAGVVAALGPRLRVLGPVAEAWAEGGGSGTEAAALLLSLLQQEQQQAEQGAAAAAAGGASAAVADFLRACGLTTAGATGPGGGALGLAASASLCTALGIPIAEGVGPAAELDPSDWVLAGGGGPPSVAGVLGPLEALQSAEASVAAAATLLRAFGPVVATGLRAAPSAAAGGAGLLSAEERRGRCEALARAWADLRAVAGEAAATTLAPALMQPQDEEGAPATAEMSGDGWALRLAAAARGAARGFLEGARAWVAAYDAWALDAPPPAPQAASD